jgi:pyrimidine-specific ribonucleoside hydrolase
MNRRQLLAAGAAAVTGIPAFRHRTTEYIGNQTGAGSTPLIHTTDLYHPPQDPDDHFDLATVLALDEYDLRGVILDPTDRLLNPPPETNDGPRDPGFVPVMQIAYVLGRAFPVAAGPSAPLKTPNDDVADRTPAEQAGINLLLDILGRSTEPVVVSVVGSCRTIAAAYNRNPGLLHAKVRAVLLNAGSLGGSAHEWNVGLDPEAYKALWRSGLPIHWYPCATERGAFDTDHAHGSYWKTTQSLLLSNAAPSLQSWFAYALTGSKRADIIRALSEKPVDAVWQEILTRERNLWSTASLVMSAGRTLTKSPEGWRFVPSRTLPNDGTWPWQLEPIRASVDESANVHWELTERGNANASLFRRQPGKEYGQAMAEALAGLLASLR